MLCTAGVGKSESREGEEERGRRRTVGLGRLWGQGVLEGRAGGEDRGVHGQGRVDLCMGRVSDWFIRRREEGKRTGAGPVEFLLL